MTINPLVEHLDNLEYFLDVVGSPMGAKEN